MPVEFLDSKCMVSILNSSFMLLYKQYKVAFWADVLFATIVINLHKLHHNMKDQIGSFVEDVSVWSWNFTFPVTCQFNF